VHPLVVLVDSPSCTAEHHTGWPTLTLRLEFEPVSVLQFDLDHGFSKHHKELDRYPRGLKDKDLEV
jgi:hypothetical protein